MYHCVVMSCPATNGQVSIKTEGSVCRNKRQDVMPNFVLHASDKNREWTFTSPTLAWKALLDECLRRDFVFSRRGHLRGFTGVSVIYYYWLNGFCGCRNCPLAHLLGAGCSNWRRSVEGHVLHQTQGWHFLFGYYFPYLDIITWPSMHLQGLHQDWHLLNTPFPIP